MNQNAVGDESNMWDMLKECVSQQLPFLNSVEIERWNFEVPKHPSEFFNGSKPILTTIRFSDLRHDSPKLSTEQRITDATSSIALRKSATILQLSSLINRGKIQKTDEGTFQELNLTNLLDQLKADLGKFWEKSGVFYDPIVKDSQHAYKIMGTHNWGSRVFECLASDPPIALSDDAKGVQNVLNDLAGRDISWHVQNPGAMIFCVDWPIASIDTWRVFKNGSLECLRIHLKYNRIFAEGNLYKCNLKLRVQLMDKDKIPFFVQEIDDNGLSFERGRRPYIEILPSTSGEIYSAKVELFFNDIQIDESEAFVLREIKVNVQVQRARQ